MATPYVYFVVRYYERDVWESDGTITHELRLSEASSLPVTVTITAQGKSEDFATATQTITFQPGQTTATFTAAVYDDDEVGGGATYSFRITEATNALLPDESTSVSGRILSNEVYDKGNVYAATQSDVTLYGSSAGDTITGLSGSNYLRGNEGTDSIQGGSGFDDAHGNAGADTVDGGAGDDWTVGGQGNDLLFGGSGFDVVYGNLGDDSLQGGSGNDWIRGGQDDDTLYGGAGDDFLSGDRGSDTLTGGDGADIFNIFVGARGDWVTDFNGAEGDRIRIEASGFSVVVTGGSTAIQVSSGDYLYLYGVMNFQTSWIIRG